MTDERREERRDEGPDEAATERWLSPTEQRAWRAWIDASRQIEAAIERQLKEDHGLSVDDYEVMVRLSEAPTRSMRMSDLAASVANSPSRMSQRVDRMVDRGLVTREPSPSDGRVWFAVLTDAGFAELEAAAPGHVDEVRRRFVDRLTPAQIDELARILPALLED